MQKKNWGGKFYFFTKKNWFFGRFFCFSRPAFGHGHLGHPQSLEYTFFFTLKYIFFFFYDFRSFHLFISEWKENLLVFYNPVYVWDRLRKFKYKGIMAEWCASQIKNVMALIVVVNDFMFKELFELNTNCWTWLINCRMNSKSYVKS